MPISNKRTKSISDPRYRKIVLKLVHLRKMAELSQLELSQRIGLSQPDISKIENCQRRIDITEFFDWLQATSNSDASVIVQLWGELHDDKSG